MGGGRIIPGSRPSEGKGPEGSGLRGFQEKRGQYGWKEIAGENTMNEV